jgi:hypothetical protein
MHAIYEMPIPVDGNHEGHEDEFHVYQFNPIQFGVMISPRPSIGRLSAPAALHGAGT